MALFQPKSFQDAALKPVISALINVGKVPARNKLPSMPWVVREIVDNLLYSKISIYSAGVTLLYQQVPSTVETIVGFLLQNGFVRIPTAGYLRVPLRYQGKPLCSTVCFRLQYSCFLGDFIRVSIWQITQKPLVCVFCDDRFSTLKPLLEELKGLVPGAKINFASARETEIVMPKFVTCMPDACFLFIDISD